MASIGAKRDLATTELSADLKRAPDKHAVAEGDLNKSKRDIVALQQRVEAAEGQRGVATKQVEELLARESALQQKLKHVETERNLATMNALLSPLLCPGKERILPPHSHRSTTGARLLGNLPRSEELRSLHRSVRSGGSGYNRGSAFPSI